MACVELETVALSMHWPQSSGYAQSGAHYVSLQSPSRINARTWALRYVMWSATYRTAVISNIRDSGVSHVGTSVWQQED